ncbi:MAG: T9SS type A sorting domain-containing protein [Bacteroidetes bacterium]|nr:T9SS type A sorting domain-containing protein [Bacteroidota bacterium]
MEKSILILIAFISHSLFTHAQSIPNNGFENWTSMGTYNNPDNWASLNDLTATMNTFTCVKGTPGVVGTSFIKLVSKTVTGMGVMPGVAVCGTLDMVSFQAGSGFAYNERPELLAGKWQYMAYGADQGFIAVALTKWNSMLMQRDTVAIAYYALPGMVMSWANFSFPLTYMNGDNPDSCIIILSASQAYGAPAAANSYLLADELNFSGLVAGISTQPESRNISISPNPVNDFISLDFSMLSNVPVSILIYDVLGNKVKIIDRDEISVHSSIFISELPKGVYMINSQTTSGIITKKFVKQ